MEYLAIDMRHLEKMYKVRILCVSRPGGTVFRSDEIEGWTDKLPEVGLQFCMVGEPLDPAYDGRWVNTSLVVDMCWEENLIDFKTESGSHYQVIVLVQPKENPCLS